MCDNMTESLEVLNNSDHVLRFSKQTQTETPKYVVVKVLKSRNPKMPIGTEFLIDPDTNKIVKEIKGEEL